MSLRILVWNYWVGKEKGTTKCICGNEIQQLAFECGHIIPHSEGGEDSVENLRPICSFCNKSMSNDNFYAFMERIGIKTIADVRKSMALPEDIISEFHLVKIQDTTVAKVYSLPHSGLIYAALQPYLGKMNSTIENMKYGILIANRTAHQIYGAALYIKAYWGR